MTPVGLWSRIVVGALLAIALPLTLEIPPPTHLHASPALALGAGLAVGTALYSAVARRRLLPVRPAGVTRTAFIIGWATVEEILWRWLLLGGLALTIPTGAAFATATIAFALTHAHGRRVHIGTGGTFGGLYLVTGTLLAPLVAHIVYNLLVAGSLSAARPGAQLG